MRRLLSTLILTLASLIPAQVLANPAMDGTWRVAVMKKGTDKTSLSKKDYTLVLTFDDAHKTWSAEAKGDDGKKAGRKREGTYRAEGEKVILESNGKEHELRVIVKGNQMVLSPLDEPNLRLIALKVK